MKMTSAYANKLLKQLNEDKSFWEKKEEDGSLYYAEVDETPVVPDYDYKEVSDTIDGIDRKIVILKHAINLANLTNSIEVGDETFTIDQVLVRMAQLNKRKAFLDNLRKQMPKSRREPGRYSYRTGNSEYQYINYDLNLIKQEFERVSSEIMAMQMALDKYNQTFEFEVEY